MVDHIVDPHPAVATLNIIKFLKDGGIELDKEQIMEINNIVVKSSVRSRHLEKLATEVGINVWAE
jgi:TATA-box binding protein (TBP) (component of TFIID and TFIIIB)